MEVNIYRQPATPKDWHWAITPQQVEEIKQGNRATIDQVYFDNLPKFRSVSFNICYRHHKKDFFEDCLQQIYVDLPTFRFTNTKTFFHSLLYSCYCAFRRGGCSVSVVASLDAPLSSKGSKRQEQSSRTLADIIPAVDVYEYEQEEQDKRVLTILDALELSEQEKDVLTAVAFGCAVHRGLYGWLRQKYQ